MTGSADGIVFTSFRPVVGFIQENTGQEEQRNFPARLSIYA